MLKTQEYLRSVHCILHTAANWRSPIEHFKLTIAKRSAGEKVSLCLSDARKTSPTNFEVDRSLFSSNGGPGVLACASIPSPGQ
jgi:hypothetical protein